MANDNGGAGGIKDGHAVRRADGWESPPSLGWLKLPPPSPQGGPEIKFGPGSKAWDSRSAAKTLGQTSGRKPKR